MTIGSSTYRKEALEKVTSAEKFTDDFTNPAMLHAKLIVSPHGQSVAGVLYEISYKAVCEAVCHWGFVRNIVQSGVRGSLSLGLCTKYRTKRCTR